MQASVFAAAVTNPFGAPVYYRETLGSTMDEARFLASGGAAHGMVVAADYQSAGRGRSGRHWIMNPGENLSFTVILRHADTALPAGLTLRAGLALSLAVEDFVPDLRGRTRVKWPNDLMLTEQNGMGKKAAGILTEASSDTVFLGIGVNIAQSSFPPELADKACSIAERLGLSVEETAALAARRFELMETVLIRLRKELEDGEADWKRRLEERLYLKGRRAAFVPGPPSSGAAAAGRAVEGTLEGIGDSGELLLKPDGKAAAAYTAGELLVYD
jgi:BirA family biotin operon repressor/biotin-[acetyl-CoA-carboxylase] ligase